MIRYLYLDDENLERKVSPIAAGFSKKDVLKVIPINPLSWAEQLSLLSYIFAKQETNNTTCSEKVNEQIQYIKAQLGIKENDALPSFDGLILDLRLDIVSSGHNGIRYRGLAVAQELRTLTTEGITKSFPIILCSDSEKIKQSYKYDDTGQNIFDFKYPKESLDRKRYKEAQEELIALATGYQTLQEHKQEIKTILGIAEKHIDYRVVNHIKYQLEADTVPIHDYARFVHKNLILQTGLLIDEAILTARLGVDKVKCKEDWEVLISKHLVVTKYTGIFAAAWPRWWMELIENWWQKHFDNEERLEVLVAQERVELLNQKFDLSLVPAQKTAKSTRSDFWTVCKKTKQPIAIEDGILLTNKNYQRLLWLEDEYFSIDTALALDNNNAIHPLEWKRVDRLQKKYKREKN